MKKVTCAAFLFIASLQLHCQTIKTKEIIIKETNTYVLNIIVGKINIRFKEDVSYNWYNEHSGWQTTKGGSGGSLIHGKLLIFNELGKLEQERFYKFGVIDSTYTSWDQYGEIIRKDIYKEGKLFYSRYKNGDNKTIELTNFRGDRFELKQFDSNNTLEEEHNFYSFDPMIFEIKEYYPYSKKLKRHFFSYEGNYYGQYIEFFENGYTKCIGKYDTKYKLGHKVGKWILCHKDLNRCDTIIYKLVENKIGTSGNKEIGSLVFNSELNDWLYDGDWYNVDENGLSVYKIKNYPEKLEFSSNQSINEYESMGLVTIIKFSKTENGLIEIPIVLNGVLKISFILDSGASEVSLSPDVALTLFRTGTITEEDWLPDKTFRFADGTLAKSQRFTINKLSIGDQILTNVEARIANSINAPMLIGQNVLNKLGVITIDFENLVLIIKHNDN